MNRSLSLVILSEAKDLGDSAEILRRSAPQDDREAGDLFGRKERT